MKKTLLLPIMLLALAFAGCKDNYDDFEFSGTVVAMETCTSMNDLGYAVSLSNPTDIGGDYKVSENETHHNVVVVYRADRMLKNHDHISGRIYLDPNHSKALCNYNYRSTTGDVPEACFTQLKVE